MYTYIYIYTNKNNNNNVNVNVDNNNNNNMYVYMYVYIYIYEIVYDIVLCHNISYHTTLHHVVMTSGSWRPALALSSGTVARTSTGSVVLDPRSMILLLVV